MGSLQTPPGHPGHSLALITAKFGDLKIAVAAPDADLKVRESLYYPYIHNFICCDAEF
jgi:hypothetical protein